MNRQEKIQLLKDVQSGDASKIKRIREQKRNNDYFYPVFDYLCKHGRQCNSNWIKGNPAITFEDLPDLKKMEVTELSEISLDTLRKACEIFDTIEMMDKAGTLKNLPPCYESKVKPLSEMKGEGFTIAGEDLSGKAIIYVDADRLTGEQIEAFQNS